MRCAGHGVGGAWCVDRERPRQTVGDLGPTPRSPLKVRLGSAKCPVSWGDSAGREVLQSPVSGFDSRVTEQLVQLKDGSFLCKEPKTAAGVRSITLSRFSAGVLETHMSIYTLPDADALVFANGAGNPLASSSFLTHHFSPAQSAAAVSCRFHDLRHTSVALAIAAGAHPKAIQSRMGHSSINVTLDRYGHLFPELDEAIAEAFGRSLHEATERRSRVVVEGDFGRTT